MLQRVHQCGLINTSPRAVLIGWAVGFISARDWALIKWCVSGEAGMQADKIDALSNSLGEQYCAGGLEALHRGEVNVRCKARACRIHSAPVALRPDVRPIPTMPPSYPSLGRQHMRWMPALPLTGAHRRSPSPPAGQSSTACSDFRSGIGEHTGVFVTSMPGFRCRHVDMIKPTPKFASRRTLTFGAPSSSADTESVTVGQSTSAQPAPQQTPSVIGHCLG